MTTSNLMRGKRGLIMGVANERSIAWGIAQELHAAGAELAFSYYNEKLKSRVEPLAAQVGSSLIFECNVESDESIAKGFQQVEKHWGEIDFVVHAIAFADKECLRGRFIDTTREQFALALDASAYSFVGVARAAEPLLKEGGSLLTLSYLGSQVIIPNYNVMGVAKAALEASTRYLAEDLGKKGIRVNTLSAGPIKTLAASAIGGLKSMLEHDAATAPLRRNVTQNEVGKAAVFLLSDLASGVTGELMYVDGGANVAGGM